jgi:hypothetical protein
MFTIHTPGSIKEMRYVLSMLKPIPQITKSGNYITGDLEDPCTDLDTTEREEYIRKRLREANMSLMDPPSSKPKEVVESVDMPEMADVDYKEIGARKKSEPKPVKSSKKKEPIEGPMATIPKPADVPIQVELFPESVSEPEPESILHDMHMSSLENVTIDVVTIAEVRDAEKAGEMKQAEETVQMTESKTSQEQEQDTDAKPRIRRSTAEVMETKVNAAITLLTEQGYSVEKKQAAKTEEHSLAGIAKELSNIASSLSSLAEKESKQTVSLDALAKIDLLSVVKQSLQLQ